MLRAKIGCGLFLIGLFFFPRPVFLSAGVVDQMMAVIDGEPYTLSNLKEYAKIKGGRDFPVGDLNKIGKEDQEVLEEFITEKLLAAEVDQAGIKVTAEDVQKYVDQIKEKNRLTDADLKDALSREGMTMEKYLASVRSDLEKNEIINRQVRNKVNVTAEDVERYYQLNAKKYTTGDRVRLRHILLSLPEGAPPEREKEAMRKAREIHDRALAGEDFAKLARDYSEGAGAKDGGDIGWVTRGSLLKEIEDLAFNRLSVGAVSEPVRTSLGIHLVKLEIREPGRSLPLSEVREKIKEEIYAKALEERFQKWLKTDLRRKHRVDIKIAGVVFRPEETKEGTMDSLVGSAPEKKSNERSSFLSYLNPLSYIVSETPIEGEDSGKEVSGRNIVSVFGVPLFTTESADATADTILSPSTADTILPPSEEKDGSAKKSDESPGVFSSILKTLNPFSSSSKP